MLRQGMKLPVEILDHIFSFLLSHRGTLTACSQDPLLSPIVERHFYHHVVVNDRNGRSDSDNAFEPGQLSKLILENPRILSYVRILQIHQAIWYQAVTEDTRETLLMFPVLECIMLTTTYNSGWSWSQVFRAALEDRLNLPTVKSLHLVGGTGFEFSVLDNCKSIEKLSLSGGLWPKGQFCDSTLPRLKSLTLSTKSISSSVLAWLKLHNDELLSLRCALLMGQGVSESLEICPRTLKNLEIDFTESFYYDHHPRESGIGPLLEFSPIPPNLQQLIIRTVVNRSSKFCTTWLPAAAKAIDVFKDSSPQHLTLDIDIALHLIRDLSLIDFSPLAVLGPASLLIPRIDLYVHADTLLSGVTRAQLLTLLADYEDIMRSIEEGRLVIHAEKTAPDFDTILSQPT